MASQNETSQNFLPSSEGEHGEEHLRSRMLIVVGAIVLLVLAAVVIALAVRYAQESYDRDVRNWEVRLGLTADARAQAVSSWVSDQKEELSAIANNMNLRLYLTEVIEMEEALLSGEEMESPDMMQVSFLRNYLSATAQRVGYQAQVTNMVPANVAVEGNAGLYLLLHMAHMPEEGQRPLMVSTVGAPAIKGKIEEFINSVPLTKTQMLPPYLNKNGEVSIAFLVPVYAVQGDEIAESQIGFILGVRTIDESLFPLLKTPAVAEKTAETLLLQKGNNDVFEYLSPLRDGTGALERKSSSHSPQLALTSAIKHTNGFEIDKEDYAGKNVLMTSRAIEGTDWTLLHKVEKKEALWDSERRRVGVISMAMLASGLVLVLVWGVWRHGTSLRYKRLAARFKSQERLLRLVTDNQPDPMFILDSGGRFCFANEPVSRQVRMQRDAITGKRVVDVFGAAAASDYHELQKKAHEAGNMSYLRRIADDSKPGGERVVQTRYIPLDRVPRILTGGATSGVLVVEQDITRAIIERERRERSLNQLIDTLVTLIDRRDSYSADHSRHVAQIAQAIASEMHLEQSYIDTVVIAAKLMNLGKILLPRSLLEKTGKLTAAERKQVEAAIASSADFLGDLEFNGPVVETLQQARENWDGSGPLNLSGEASLITARIVNLANAFVAMVSSRAYRKGMDTDTVLKLFMDDIGTRYERRVVVALANYLENTKNAPDWLKGE